MQCARTMVGISSATYFLLSLSLSDLSWPGEPQTRILWLSDDRTKPELLTRQTKILYFCIFQVCKISNILRLHSHFFFVFLFLSLSDSFLLVAVYSIVATKNVMLLPCIRAPLNGQFDLLGDERGPRVAGGAYLRAWPFVSLHIVSLEAR